MPLDRGEGLERIGKNTVYHSQTSRSTVGKEKPITDKGKEKQLARSSSPGPGGGRAAGKEQGCTARSDAEDCLLLGG